MRNGTINNLGFVVCSKLFEVIQNNINVMHVVVSYDHLRFTKFP